MTGFIDPEKVPPKKRAIAKLRADPDEILFQLEHFDEFEQECRTIAAKEYPHVPKEDIDLQIADIKATLELLKKEYFPDE